MKAVRILLLCAALLVSLSACAQATSAPPPTPIPQATKPPAPTEIPPTPPPAPTDTLAPSATAAPPTATEAPAAPTALPPDEQRIEFQTEDGALLVGSYYPGATNPAPLVILMHQARSDRYAWETLAGLISWLQNRPAGSGALFAPLRANPTLPPMPAGVSFAVFAFDFRGHGESAGGGGPDDWLKDARAAIQAAKGLPGVDPARIVLIGASFGADATVDTFTEGCLGAITLSPGSYLQIDYTQAVAEVDAQGKPVLCLAAQGDTHSAQACQAAQGEHYQSQVYPGDQHGVFLLAPGGPPDAGQQVLDFLLSVFGLAP